MHSCQCHNGYELLPQCRNRGDKSNQIVLIKNFKEYFNGHHFGRKGL